MKSCSTRWGDPSNNDAALGDPPVDFSIFDDDTISLENNLPSQMKYDIKKLFHEATHKNVDPLLRYNHVN